MPEMRFRFEKRGRAAYLSHLDVMRTFQRAMIRAGVRVRHSEGFNPHPKMSIALPLQLGCESVCEVLDVSVLEAPENLTEALNAALPEGIAILSAGPVGAPVREIAWTEWALAFPEEAAAAEAEKILRLPSLPVEKKTKRGVGTLEVYGEEIIVFEKEQQPQIDDRVHRQDELRPIPAPIHQKAGGIVHRDGEDHQEDKDRLAPPVKDQIDEEKPEPAPAHRQKIVHRQHGGQVEEQEQKAGKDHDLVDYPFSGLNLDSGLASAATCRSVLSMWV